MEQLIAQGLAERGLLGLLFVGAVLVLIRKEAEIKEIRSFYEKRLAEERALNTSLQEARFSELKTIVEAIQSMRVTLDAALAALRGVAR